MRSTLPEHVVEKLQHSETYFQLWRGWKVCNKQELGAALGRPWSWATQVIFWSAVDSSIQGLCVAHLESAVDFLRTLTKCCFQVCGQLRTCSLRHSDHAFHGALQPLLGFRQEDIGPMSTFVFRRLRLRASVWAPRRCPLKVKPNPLWLIIIIMIIIIIQNLPSRPFKKSIFSRLWLLSIFCFLRAFGTDLSRSLSPPVWRSWTWPHHIPERSK